MTERPGKAPEAFGRLEEEGRAFSLAGCAGGSLLPCAEPSPAAYPHFCR